MNMQSHLGSRLAVSVRRLRDQLSSVKVCLPRHARMRARSKLLNSFLALLLLSVPSGPWRPLAQARGTVVDQLNAASERARADTILFFEYTIADDFDGVMNVHAADIDGDEDLDILGVSYAGSISWWENNGSQIFTEQTIVEGLPGPGSVQAADVDSDGDVDVVAAEGFAGDISWWENDGSETFTKHSIADNRDGVGWVVAADVDSDGNVDILGASNPDQISWWENDGSENFSEHLITDSFDGANFVCANDLDDDGDVDVLGTAFIAGDISWWENDGSETFTEHTIAEGFEGVGSVQAADVDGDGDVDVLGTAIIAGDISWWENDGSEIFTQHTIVDNRDGVGQVVTADVDGDGDADILGVSNPGQISWWENDGSENFTEHLIAGGFGGANSVCANDLDDDGDVDVLGTAFGPGDIAWWEQRDISDNNPPIEPSAPSPVDGATDVSTDADLSWTGGDPDPGDTVTYDVYLQAGDSNPEDRVCDDLLTASCDPGTLDADTHYTWYVVATDVFSVSTTGDNWGFTTEFVSRVYLPLVAKRYPPIPGVPVLDAISNPDGDGAYTVSWGSADLADTYTLQEDDNRRFSSPTERYSGAGLSWDATDKAPGTYYYRVKATNSWNGEQLDSGWSNVESVTVPTVEQFAKPGSWTGTYDSSFIVTTNNKVQDFSVTLPIPEPEGGECEITLSEEAAIEDKHFSLGIVQGVFKFVEGDFATPTTLTGIFHSVACEDQIWFYDEPLQWEASWEQASSLRRR